MGYRLPAFLLLLLPVFLIPGCSKDDDSKTNPAVGNQHRITLTSPNGGESWLAGSSHDIAWTDSNVTETTVLYSENDGVNWITLTASTTANSFTWTVPAAPSTSCRIMVMDASDSTVADASDSAFTVVYQHDLRIVSPNGGESWEAGTIQAVSWTGHNVGSVRLFFSPDSGAHWTTTTAAMADTSFPWPVPAAPSPNYLIKVVDAADSTVFDVSDSVFAVTYLREIVVHTPNGGEVWTQGSMRHVTWSDENVTLATVQFSGNNGASWITLTDSTADTSYAWTIGAISSESCLVRVFDSADSTVTDVSDATFTLQAVRTITVTSPNGGESWVAGSVQAITWNGPAGGSARIFYSPDNGTSWSMLSATATEESYSWTIPIATTIAGRIRVEDTADSTVNDISDEAFAITAAGNDAASHLYTSTTGGTFTTPGGARMTVPVGAVPLTDLGATGSMMFSIERNDDAPITLPAGETLVSGIYLFGPEGFVLARPVEIALPVYGTNPADVRIWRRNPTTGAPEYFGVNYDAGTHTVRAQTYAFSTWFVTTGTTADDAAGCLAVGNETMQWLSVCVESYTLDYPGQADWIPELGQSVIFAPLGTGDWPSTGRVFLPQGTYALCLDYHDGSQYVSEERSGVVIGEPWTTASPHCTELAVSPFNNPVVGRCVCVPEPTTSVGTGDIQVTLVWHSAESLDLDLWVMDPDSEWCYFGNGQYPATTTSGGQLDRDNLCANYFNGRPENIYWTQPPPVGTYTVGVAWYSDCGNGLSSMPVDVRTVVQGVTQTFNAVLTPDLGSMTPMEITRFEIVGSTVQFLPPRPEVTYPNLPANVVKTTATR